MVWYEIGGHIMNEYCDICAAKSVSQSVSHSNDFEFYSLVLPFVFFILITNFHK